MKKEFLIAKYNNCTSVFSRIKQDEQRWISTLFVIYGAFIYFLISNNADFLKNYNDVLILTLILLINIIIFFTWAHQSLNLRVQYYNSVIELMKVRYEFKEVLDDIWYKNNFKEWRKLITKPTETKVIDFILLGGLFAVTGFVSILRFSELKLSAFGTGEIFLIIFIFIGLFIPFCYYPWLDSKKMKKIYNNISFKKKK